MSLRTRLHYDIHISYLMPWQACSSRRGRRLVQQAYKAPPISGNTSARKISKVTHLCLLLVPPTVEDDWLASIIDSMRIDSDAS